MHSPDSSIEDGARRIVYQLPEGATWEDLIDRISVRQSIEAGLKDADEGQVEPVEEVRRPFGLPD